MQTLNVIIPDSICVTKHNAITCTAAQHNMEVHFKGFQKACLFTSHWESISGRPKLSCCLSPSSPLSSAAQGQIVLTKHSDLYSDWSQKVSYSQSGALNTIIRFSLLFKNNLHKGYYLLWYVFKLQYTDYFCFWERGWRFESWLICNSYLWLTGSASCLTTKVLEVIETTTWRFNMRLLEQEVKVLYAKLYSMHKGYS